MKKLLLSALLLASFGFAQEEPYQVPGFPPFSPAPTMLDVVEDRGDTVVVRHVFGETEIPKNPQRVHAQVNVELPLALGLNVVSGLYLSDFSIPPALAEAAQNTELFDYADVPNYEFILSQQPDLILDWHWEVDADRYEQLSRIAPTVSFYADPYVYWQRATRDLAAALGLESRAEELIQRYERDAEVQCERIRSVIGGETLNVFSIYQRSFFLASPVWEQT